ncbi:MAG TPA: hypothetical protein VH518_06225 [Tepidisphaeraceae bacterium]|jgi:hypothetical protein
MQKLAKSVVFTAAALAVGVLLGQRDAHGAVLATWTFETSQPATAGPFVPEVGLGSALGGTGGTYSSPAGNGSAHSFSSNGWDVGDNYQFSVAGDGSTEYHITFDQTSSNTGPRDFKVQFSTDGTTFNDLPTAFNYQVPANAGANTWNTTTPVAGATFSAGLTLGSSPASLFFRLVDTSTTSANGTTVASGGTDRVDNVTINSGPVPEPASLGLIMVLAAPLCARRRRS